MPGKAAMIRCRSICACGIGSWPAAPRCRASISRIPWERSPKRAAAWCTRSCCCSSSRSCRRPRSAPPARSRRRMWWMARARRRSTASCRSPLPRSSSRLVRISSRAWRRPRRPTTCCSATWARAKPPSRPSPLPRWPIRAPRRRSWRPPRCSRASMPRRWGSGSTKWASPGACSRVPRPMTSAPACLKAQPTAASACSSARTRCSSPMCASSASRSRSSTSSSASAWSSARRFFPKGKPPMRST